MNTCRQKASLKLDQTKPADLPVMGRAPVLKAG